MSVNEDYQWTCTNCGKLLATIQDGYTDPNGRSVLRGNFYCKDFSCMEVVMEGQIERHQDSCGYWRDGFRFKDIEPIIKVRVDTGEPSNIDSLLVKLKQAIAYRDEMIKGIRLDCYNQRVQYERLINSLCMQKEELQRANNELQVRCEDLRKIISNLHRWRFSTD